MPDKSPAAIVREFQKRKARTFRLCRPWIAMIVIGFVGCFALNKRVDNFIVLLFFMGAFFGIIAFVFIVKAYYKCPNCEAVVWTSEGVALNPEECPHCNARLIP